MFAPKLRIPVLRENRTFFRNCARRLSALPDLLKVHREKMQVDKNLPSDVKLSRLLARSGVCSLLECDELLRSGRVSVDGESIYAPRNVNLLSDVTIDNVDIPPMSPAELYIFHKPRGMTCKRVAEDFTKKPVITMYDHFEKLGFPASHLVPVSPLPINATGVVLLTNSGEVQQTLEGSRTAPRQTYTARVLGVPRGGQLALMAKPRFRIGNIAYGPVHVKVLGQKLRTSILSIDLMLGQRRNLRKLIEHMGWQLQRFERTAIGPYKLGNLPEGSVLRSFLKEDILRRMRREGLVDLHTRYHTLLSQAPPDVQARKRRKGGMYHRESVLQVVDSLEG
eukprot:Rmarinus@m.4473